MTDSTRAFARILAYIAAISLVAVSCSMNVMAGIAKSETLTGQITWGAASAASDILKAVSPLFIAYAVVQRDLLRVIAAVIVLLTTGGYSVVSAITYSHGGRLESASAITTGADAHERASARYSNAKAALGAMPSTKPPAELKAAIAGALANPAVGTCETMDGPVSRKVCPGVSEMRAELARALERERLQSELQAATALLDVMRPARIADPATDALVRLAAQFGVQLQPGDVALWLSLSGVVLIEVGSTLGLLLASGGTATAATPSPALSLPTAVALPAAPVAPIEPAAQHINPVQVLSTQSPLQGTQGRKRGRPRLGTTSAAMGRLKAIAVNGRIEASQMVIGSALGMSKATAHRELKRLAEAGVVRLATCAKGTTINLL